MGHEVLAAVLQVRGAITPGHAVASALGNRTLTAGHCPAESCGSTRTSRRRSAVSWPRRSTCDSSHTSSSSRSSAPRTAFRARAWWPRAFLGLVPSDVDPERPGGHRVAPGRRRSPDGVRPRVDRAPSTAPAAARSCRTRTSVSPWRHRSSPSRRCATCTPPRWATACPPPTCNACCPAAVLLEPTGDTAPPGPAGGRPAALFRFSARGIKVTDPFAVLRPPGSGRPAGAAR